MNKFDYVIVTHIPAFYKVNLYNELSKKLKILVVFIATNTNEKRAEDFITLENAQFEYRVLFDGNLQDRIIKTNILELKAILKTTHFKKIIVGGWDLKEFWYIVFTNKKAKNCLALESTVNESKIDGIRGVLKFCFLRRMSIIFASGQSHIELLNVLGYKGQIKITKGVGIINKPSFTPIRRNYNKRFLFIGRLSPEKNIRQLIEIFNTLPDFTFSLIGTGPQEKELKAIANVNTIFLGQIENYKLQEYFLTNDIFILPSISEPWGLVVEEALYFGVPVMISQNCGASELVEDGVSGCVMDIASSERIKEFILSIDEKKYGFLLNGVKKYSVNNKDEIQIGIYEL